MNNQFNKNCFDILIEGVNTEENELENIVAFDDLDVAIESIDNIIKECRNDFIELQQIQYLDELVVENMIYTDFNEEKIVATLEAMSKEQKDNIIKKLKAQWEKIKTWISTTIKTLYNIYTSSEKLINDNKAVIPDAVRNCNVTVKMNEWEDLTTGLNKCAKIRATLNNAVTYEKGASFNKEEILSSINAQDRADVQKITRKAFIRKANVETKISSINYNQAINYITNMKKVIDFLKNEQAMTDSIYKERINYFENANNEDIDVSTNMAILNFVIGLKLTVLRTEISCIKQASTEYTAVIRRALTENIKRQKK